MLNLAEWGMYERDDANDTTSDDPKWLSAYDYIMSEWMKDNSPIWQWLKLKGIDEVAAVKRILKFK